MSRTAEFIAWKMQQDKGNIDELACIISEANSLVLVDAFIDVCRKPYNDLNQRQFVNASINTLDDYLKSKQSHMMGRSYYDMMDEDKEENPQDEPDFEDLGRRYGGTL